MAAAKARVEKNLPRPFGDAKRLAQAFGIRLTQAVTSSPNAPVKNNGRLAWIQKQLESRYGIHASVETVRKWLAGEAMPRPEKTVRLAQLLDVDSAWLSLGVDPKLQPRERRVRNAMADGAVNVVAGLIQMDGGHPAFPDPPKPSIDLHAIIKGAQYNLHIALGEQDGKKFRFAVPTKCDEALILGLVKRGFAFDVFEITPETLSNGRTHGGSIEVIIDEAEIRNRRIESFAERI